MTSQPQTDALTALFVLFPDMTQLDMTGPWQVLTRIPGLQCIAAAKSRDTVRAACGLRLMPDLDFASAPKADILVVPGGPGVEAFIRDGTSLDFIQRRGRVAKYITSVCTGALIIGAAGFLRGRNATTHWMQTDLLSVVGAKHVNQRVVRDGNIITGGGVTAGIDFGLTLAAELRGEASAKMIQLSIEYDPAPPFDAGSPSAIPETADAVRRLAGKRRDTLRTTLETAMQQLPRD